MNTGFVGIFAVSRQWALNLYSAVHFSLDFLRLPSDEYADGTTSLEALMSAMPEMLIGQAGQASQPGAIDFDTAVDEFLEYLTGYRNYSPATATSYRTDLGQFRRFLVDKLGRVPRLEEITREWVIQFGVRLKGAAPLTVRRKFGCLSSFFNFLVDMDHLRLNPARRLPLPKAEQAVPVCLTDEEVQQLVAAAVTPWGRCLVALLVCTGIRRSEAATICLEDIDLENRQLLINGKGAKQRVLPLNEMAVEAILKYLPHRGKGRIHNRKPLT
ncbi:MAG: tyrosine-type recombinase/integrase, partial [Armatimonadetes bacterium]|nr:tyrosine-type recombinase/integrase [Armatimonadota bacterium]NIO76184.1 tyrosine-type recombinase/integrase [Armatimonadota bacterium]NIO98868.1 tyrosine-type recombinase/integrase [Armatimonadota bacterium]